jgi:hypothetical protein
MVGIEVRFYDKSSWLKDADYSYIEENQILDDLLNDVLMNTRWYLDNLDYLREFRVSWGNYRSKTPPSPMKKQNIYK